MVNPTLSAILSILQLFFAKNPTVEEIVSVAVPLVTAINAAKAGQAFSVSFPETIDAVAGTTTISWAP